MAELSAMAAVAAPRTLTRRRSLPGGRAVVGGLLVTASAVGLFAASGAAAGGPRHAYVVAAHDIGAGQRFGTDDLALAPVDLPARQRARSYTSIATLVRGGVAVDRIEAGELVQHSDVGPAGARRAALVSVPVEPANALGGEGLEGERVDVIVSWTQDGDVRTETVARAVRVSRVVTGSRDLGTTGRLTVVLAASPAQLERIAGAGALGKITLAVTTGVER
jgi:Flp pilus assembly protein CpaB